MAMDRTALAITLVAAFVAAAAPAGADDGSGTPVSGPAEAETAGSVPCIPVATQWPPSSSAPSTLQPPRLAVVMTDIRPKDAVVMLDGRPVARSRYFNGKKGFLYLEPGVYELELEHDGYRAQVFEVAARPDCRYDIRHRMDRARAVKASSAASAVGKSAPLRWIWDPVEGGTATEAPPRSGGPDVRLRPDLANGASSPASVREEARGSLELRVSPAAASIYLDGSYLATAREVSLMASPLAIPAGQHVVEARAPGFEARSKQVAVTAGKLTVLELSLTQTAP